MNNLKYYNDSLAYDFEMFAPKEEKRDSRDNIVVMPNTNNKANSRRKAARRLSPTAAAILCVIMVLAAFCGNIAIRIKINEVNSQINEVKTQITELDSEKTALEVEFQRRISYVNLELEAMSLGMKKPEKDDVTYIRVNDTDVAKNADGELLD